MEQGTGWTRLGWQGIAFDVPADWCPGRLEGDHTNGYLRLEDELAIRLELRWETPGRRLPSADRLVDGYLKQSRKKLGRKAPTPKVLRGRCINRLGDVDHEAFTWYGTFNAHSLLLVCPRTRRVVHLRVFFEEGKELRKLTRRIFASVSTSSEDGLDEWSVFGLTFRVPGSWRLESSALRTGCLQFVFSKGSDVLEIVRASLAAMTLRGRSLEAWYREFFGKALRRYHCQLAPGAHRGHPGVRCRGRQRLRARPFGLFRRRRHLTGLAWHCEPGDRLFAIRLASGTADDPQVAALADTIPCA